MNTSDRFRIRFFPWLLVAALPAAGWVLEASGTPAGDAPRFTDASDLLPVREPKLGQGRPGKFVGYGPAWLDADGDGDADLFYMNHGMLPSLFENRSGAAFADRTRVAGLRTGDWQYAQQADRHGASCGDFDNDGRTDVFIGHGASRGRTLGVKRDELLRNLGSFTFADIAGGAGVTNARGRSRLAAWADYDGDGWLDLYVMNFRSDNVVYNNSGDGRFSDVSSELELGPGKLIAAWADHDTDGDPDLLLAFPLQLMRNDGGRFVDVTRESGLGAVEVVVPRALAWQDFDNDGDPDVFVAARNSPGRLLVNDAGRFRPLDTSMQWAHDSDSEGNGAVWGDVDNDGWPDLLLTRSSGMALFMNRAGKRFEWVRFAEDERFDMDHGGEAALADFDSDGHLDVALNAVGTNYLFSNRGGEGAWLSVSFEGRASNRSGFGARVTAEARGPDGDVQRITRQYFGDNGVFRSIGCGPLHLGLGNATSVDLLVEWPSGAKQRVENVAVNQHLVVTEPVR